MASPREHRTHTPNAPKPNLERTVNHAHTSLKTHKAAMAHGGSVLGAVVATVATQRFTRFVAVVVNQGSTKSLHATHLRTQRTLHLTRLSKISKTSMLGRRGNANARIASGLGEGSA